MGRLKQRFALAAGATLVAAVPVPHAPRGASSPASPKLPASSEIHASPEIPASPGQDFIEEARLLYRVVACGGDESLPDSLDAPTVEAHCKQLLPRMETYRKRTIGPAGPFFARILSNPNPKKIPTSVVYPFGGGDLVSALTTYPQAREITTLSLELAGDPRRLRRLGKAPLAESLSLIRLTIAPLLVLNDSTSENLMKGQRGEIPGQLAFFLVALAVHGYEPVSLRYFRIDPEGSLHYLTSQEIAAEDARTARSLKGSWTPPDFSPAFSNAELTFRRRGGPADAPPRIHRHIAANLADLALRKDPSALRHLERKGRVAAMTKAASYLLWRPDFSKVRDYLLGHMELMISDSTGIPPEFAERAGFVQETYGRFSGSFLDASDRYNEEFRRLWASQPSRSLPFRYGYVDMDRSSFHMLVTRRRPGS